MLPTGNILTQEITNVTYPNRTYKVMFEDFDETKSQRDATIGKLKIGMAVIGRTRQDLLTKSSRVVGYTDGLDAVIQAIYLILSTERYKYNIYSWDYGVELIDLFGKPMPYVMSELPRRITEALTQDNRIDNVTNFEFEQKGKQLHTTFTVVTTAGNVSTALEVTV